MDNAPFPASFPTLALRTEAPAPGILMTDPERLKHLLNIVIAACNLLDNVKREVFYGVRDVATRQAQDVKNLNTVIAEAAATTTHSVARPMPAVINPRLFHGLIGKIGEAGELAEVMRRALFDAQHLDTVNLIEEMGDTLWYDALIYAAIGVPREAVESIVIDKLRTRFPDKFSNERAVNRDLGAERKALEGDAGG